MIGRLGSKSRSYDEGSACGIGVSIDGYSIVFILFFSSFVLVDIGDFEMAGQDMVARRSIVLSDPNI